MNEIFENGFSLRDFYKCNLQIATSLVTYVNSNPGIHNFPHIVSSLYNLYHKIYLCLIICIVILLNIIHLYYTI